MTKLRVDCSDQVILHLHEAANAPNDRRFQGTSQLTHATIEWVPLHNLSVPAAMSEVVNTPPF